MIIVIIYVYENLYVRGVVKLEKSYIVYRHITPDGKSYIGCTSHTIKERWNVGYKHCPLFKIACATYGWGGMQHEILAEKLTEKDAYHIEQVMIAKYQTNNPEFEYNVSKGGKSTYAGLKHTDETKDKIRKANTGAVFTEEHCKNLSKSLKGLMVGEKNPMYGKPKSAITIQRQYDSPRHEMKPVVQKDLDGNIIGTYFSIHEANRKTGVSRGCIRACLIGKQKSSKGFIWEYADTNNQ